MKLKSNSLKMFPGTIRVMMLPALILVALLINSSKLYADGTGRKVLALFKSSDGYTENNNPVKWFFENELKKQGLSVEYHDFEKSTPGMKLLDGARAVITWYNNGVVSSKEKGIEYIHFLEGALDSGKKVVIVNSFGAYGYKDGNAIKWDLDKYFKPLFLKMGFSFNGFWTNDPKKLKIAYINKEVAQKEGTQDVKRSKHFQQIVPVRNDVKTYLTIQRTDNPKGIGDGKSSVILTSSSGGFAMEQYVLYGKTLMLNPEVFIRNALFFDDGYQDVGVIIGNIENREAVIKNLDYAFKYAKIRRDYISTEETGNMIGRDLMKYEALIIAVKSSREIPLPVIKYYAEHGGNVIFIRYADLDPGYMNLMGIKSYSSSTTYFKEGFDLLPQFYMSDFPISGKRVDIRVKKADVSGVKILGSVARSSDRNNYPLVWEKKAGEGKILYWNSDFLLYKKRFRGTIIQSIHHVCDNFTTGLANIAMMMIDDFPAPWWNTYYKKYRIEYYTKKLNSASTDEEKNKYRGFIKNLEKYQQISDTDFIKDIWIKDIVGFQKKLGFRYTCFLIFNYNNKTGYENRDYDFDIRDFYLARGGLTSKMGELALEEGWDFGFHGFNHMSLTLTKPKDYASTPWPDKKTMLKALTKSRQEWEKIYTPSMLPFSYVAPHNIIDRAGVEALGEAWPSIQVLSALYVSSQGEREQEFDFTSNRRFLQIPRMSSGYDMKDADKYLLFDVLHNFGVVSHFIHPDDVFDEHRSGGFTGWDLMKNRFVSQFSSINRNYPWLRWMTVKDAYSEFIFYNNTGMNVMLDDNKITVLTSDGSDRDLYFRLSLGKGKRIGKTTGCSVVDNNRKSGDVVLKTDRHRCEISLR